VSKKPIRIIKKSERLAGPKKKSAHAAKKTHRGQDPVDLAKTVNGWVREFRNRSSEEAQKMLASIQQSDARRSAA